MTRFRLSKLLIALLGAAWLAAGAPAGAASVNTGHIEAELVAQQLSVAPGGAVQLALRLNIRPGWHTYWRNPGDSGQPAALNWTLPDGWRAGEITWPTPQRLKTGPLMTYGYTGEVLLPVRITAPATARAGQTAQLELHAGLLVCEDLCIPEEARLRLDLPVTGVAGAPDPKWSRRIAATVAAAPARAGLTAAVTANAAGLRLSVVGAALQGGDFSDAYFFPYDPSAIDQPGPQAVDRGPRGLTLTMTPGVAFKSGKPPAALEGVLTFDGRAYEISARPGPPLIGAGGLGPPSAAGGAFRLATAMGFAFLGGLILNLMPCVFPVLSMKAAALASHAHRPREARLQGMAFMGGVVATFLSLAGALIAARAAGEAVGWGFQLQSPNVVAGLTLVMLLVALNLSGVFEVGASLQSAAGQAGGADHGGVWGAAFTGALAVAVAAPCTAPFMAPAIGFALTQAPVVALAIFLALGLGLAAPFTTLAFSPRLLGLLPRPGAWMEGLRKALAFPMYATAAWLVWVFSQQAGSLNLAGLLAAGVLTGIAAWIYGVAQRRERAGGRAAGVVVVAGVAMVLAFAAALWPAGAPTRAADGALASVAFDVLTSEPFSPERLDQLRAAGGPVFVNFTAAWCVTCQVNEKLALSGRRVAEAFRKAGVVYLKADWTNRDGVIAQTLAEHGRAGVPLYLMYGAHGGEPQVLPQILTESLVIEAVDRASGASPARR
jgi:thiol:disulfide interchange protein